MSSDAGDIYRAAALSMPITTAVNEVQAALKLLKEDQHVQAAGIQFSKVDLSFVTTTKLQGEAEISLSVVTVGGAIGRQSTNTIEATLVDPATTLDGLREVATSKSIQLLVRQLAAIVLLGSDSPYPLAFSEGKVSAELLVTTEGHLEVTSEGLVIKVLKALGLFDVSAKVSGELLKTSSITVHYTAGQA